MSCCLRQRARADTQPKVKLPVQTPVGSPPSAAIERFASSLATSTNSLCRQNEHGPFISTASPETSNPPLLLVVLATGIIASTWSCYRSIAIQRNLVFIRLVQNASP